MIQTALHDISPAGDVSVADYARLWTKVEIGDCWTWVAGRDQDGYGIYSHNRRTVRAHRLVWTLLVGEIPEGLQIDHLCRNRACVNPDHLEVVTGQENTRRRHQLENHGGDNLAARQSCAHGHEFTPENTRMHGGTRICRACVRRRALASYHRRKKQ